MAGHALLSASGAYRWMNCTPSARLTESMPDTDTDYAKEGTLAHELAEYKVRKYFTADMGGAKAHEKKMAEFKASEMWDVEMLGHTDTYLDYVKGVYLRYKGTPLLETEKKLSYADYAPEGYGTADCIIISGSDLHVVDFKYGKGVPVSAEHNPQLMLYALGAISEYGAVYAIDQIHLAIIQPRLDSISEWSITRDDLLQFGDGVKDRAKIAYDGGGEYVPGEHCNFCKAKASCRARADENIKLAGFTDRKPPLISNDEVGAYLTTGSEVAKWLEDLKGYALTECLKGAKVEGWKAVEGRGSRAWTDMDAAFKVIIDSGTDEAMLYERKPLSLAKTEKLLGKKPFKTLVSDYVVKNPGKPTLAKASDKREAITTNTSAQEAFKEEL